MKFMPRYFMHPLFEYIDFSCLDEAMNHFNFDYTKIANDDMDEEIYYELCQHSFDNAFADAWFELLTGRDEAGWLWAGYWANEDGDEYFMLVKPKGERAVKAFAIMSELYPIRYCGES